MAATLNAEGKLLCDNEFKEELLSKLNELRKEKVLCDVTLRIEGQDFPAHRCVLSAASPYFRSLLTSGFKENQDNVVELQDIKPAVASEALRFIYTGEAQINATNAEDMVKTGDYFIIQSLKTKVAEYLQESIDATNCLALESLAVQYGCDPLEQTAVAFKRQNFVAVVKTDDFKALDFEKVKELVSHDEIIVSKEEDVYEAVVSWVKHDVISRECLFPDLLKCLRIFSMSKYGLREILKEELVIKSRTCTSILHEGMDFFFSPDSFLGMALKPRACLSTTESVVILTGGHKEYGSPEQKGTTNTHCLLLSKNHWLSLSAMPLPRTRHAAAACCGELYVVGGKSSDPMCSFNPKRNKWTAMNEGVLVPMRMHCSITALNEQLYVIGGKQHWKMVDRYDPNLNEWKEVASIKTARASHCAVAMGNLIFVFGGNNSTVCHKSMECFNSSANVWTEKPSMIVSRRFASAAVSSRKIFVVGGYSDVGWKTLEASCEMFDPVQDQWSMVSSPLVPRAAGAMVSFDDHLYLFGGEGGDTPKYDSVERYNVQNDKWEPFGTMPEKLACLQASVLLLPKKHINI